MSQIKTLSELFLKIVPNIEISLDLLQQYCGNDWVQYIAHINEELQYTKILIDSNEQFELYVIIWKPFCSSQIHDHPEQGCVMKIVQGCLIEDIYTNLNNNYAKLIQRNYLNLNAIASKSSNKILHKITNNNLISVSIHIYFPPNYQSNIYKEYKNIINCNSDDENETVEWSQTPKETKKYFNCGCCDNCECDDNKACVNCSCNCNCDEIEDDYDYESDDNLNILNTPHIDKCTENSKLNLVLSDDNDSKNASLNIKDFSISIVNKKEKKVRIRLELILLLNSNQELINIDFDINKSTYLKIADELI